MVPLILAMVLAVFSVMDPPFENIVPTFPLFGYTLLQDGPTLNNTSPTLGNDGTSDTLDVSFVSPVNGECRFGQIVTSNNSALPVRLGSVAVTKGSTVIRSVELYAADEVTHAGGVFTEYEVFVACKDQGKEKAILSKFYHIKPQGNSPA